MNELANLGINLSDYQSSAPNTGGFGTANTTQEQLGELTKALEAGQITGRDTEGLTNASGASLKVESLDKTLKLITFRESEIALWKKVPKLPAFNTVEEFNQLTDYGADRGGFIVEGELPQEEDSTYVRRSQLVKFLGVTKAVTHPMTLVNNMVGDVIAKEAKNGALWILRKLDRSIATANSRLIPEEFNGLYAQHEENDAFLTKDAYFDSEVVVDLRGAALTEANIEDAAEGIIENFGLGNELYAPPKVLSDFVKNFYGNKFITPNTSQTAAGIMGQRVNEFDSQFGRIGLNWDIFLNKKARKTTSTGATSPNAPATPIPDGGTPVAAVATDTSSDWTAADAGDYLYGVTAINRFGESAMAELSAVLTTIPAGGAIDLKWASGVTPPAVSAYRVYRSRADAVSGATTEFFPLFDISVAELAAGYDGAAALSVRDRDRIMPDTNQAFLIQNDEDVWAFRQLAPLMKMDLAIISTAYRFMVLLYGTLLLFAPKKVVRFINIGVA
ncbi:MAG: SU10 major capsid protein [Candidatus Heimdallarchaeaceae archaeon]